MGNKLTLKELENRINDLKLTVNLLIELDIKEMKVDILKINREMKKELI